MREKKRHNKRKVIKAREECTTVPQHFNQKASMTDPLVKNVTISKKNCKICNSKKEIYKADKLSKRFSIIPQQSNQKASKTNDTTIFNVM